MTTKDAAERISAAFESGIAPWSRSTRLRLTCELPVDAWTGRPIRGVNTWLLELSGIEQRYWNRYWATRHQWDDLGGAIVRGEGTPVLVDDEAEAVVYNLEQVEVRRGAPVAGLERFRIAPPSSPDYSLAQRLVDSTGPSVVPDDRCHCAVFADASRDFIGMPSLCFFGGDRAAYWAVMFHEVIHWVVLGRRRLCWDGEYSQGELIAEIGAGILTNHCGIPMRGELSVHGEHVQAWIRGVRGDLSYFREASAVAERAVEYVILSAVRQVLHEQVQEPFHGRDGRQPTVSPVRDRR